MYGVRGKAREPGKYGKARTLTNPAKAAHRTQPPAAFQSKWPSITIPIIHHLREISLFQIIPADEEVAHTHVAPCAVEPVAGAQLEEQFHGLFRVAGVFLAEESVTAHFMPRAEDSAAVPASGFPLLFAV